MVAKTREGRSRRNATVIVAATLAVLAILVFSAPRTLCAVTGRLCPRHIASAPVAPTVGINAPAPAVASLKTHFAPAALYRTAPTIDVILNAVRREHSVTEVSRAAGRSDPEALFLVGAAELYGIDRSRDADAALRHLEAAAAAGFPRATFAIAQMHWRGGDGADKAVGRREMLMLAEGGFPPAQALIGSDLLYQSPATTAAQQEGLRFVEAAAQAGNAEGIEELARLVWRDREFGQGAETALQLYEAAGSGESPEALLWLGRLYRYGGLRPADPPRALGYYRHAAALGSDEATIEAAEMLEVGQGAPADPVAARALLLTAEQAGSTQAKQALALAVISGRIPARPDFNAEKAAVEADRAGQPDALVTLVNALRKGTHGYRPDIAKAGALGLAGYRRFITRTPYMDGGSPQTGLILGRAAAAAVAAGKLDLLPGEAAAIEDRFGGPDAETISFSLPVDCDGAKGTFIFIVWDSRVGEPVDDQLTWLGASRRCNPIGVDGKPSQIVPLRNLYLQSRRDHRSYVAAVRAALKKAEASPQP